MNNLALEIIGLEEFEPTFFEFCAKLVKHERNEHGAVDVELCGNVQITEGRGNFCDLIFGVNLLFSEVMHAGNLEGQKDIGQNSPSGELGDMLHASRDDRGKLL